jgi:hypothetical protein
VVAGESFRSTTGVYSRQSQLFINKGGTMQAEQGGEGGGRIAMYGWGMGGDAQRKCVRCMQGWCCGLSLMTWTVVETFLNTR